MVAGSEQSIFLRPMKTRHLLTLASALALLPGCTMNEQHRFVGKQYEGDNTKAAFEKYDPAGGRPYQLSYVEFDERGDYWDRAQIADAAHRIHHSDKPLLLVEFIHGWHNDSSEQAGDVARFRCLLKQLGMTPATSQLRVHGVFIGWRGESVARNPLLWVPKQLSLFNRKSAIERAAGHPMADAVYWLVRETRKYQPGSRTVLVGHSLGALGMEKILAQSLPARLYTYGSKSADAAHGGELYTPADMILLLNSAAESSYAKELVDTFRRIPRNPGSNTSIDPEHPLLISITSKADQATGKFFPIGTGLSNLFGTFRDYHLTKKYDGTDDVVNQRQYFTTTPGHNPHLVTHEVVSINPEGKVRVTAGKWDETVGECRPEINPAFEQNLNHPEHMRFVTGEKEHYDRWEIRRKPGGELTSYWLVEVPGELIPGHGDIFNPNARAMMAAFFRINNLMQKGAPRTMSASSVGRPAEAPRAAR